jgi:hypothetical protein
MSLEVSRARIIHKCRREAAETEVCHFTRPPQARQDAPLPVGFSQGARRDE